MQSPGQKPGLFFRLVIPATSLFVVTILAMIAVALGDGRSPVAQFLDRHGNQLLKIEFLTIVSLILLALFFGRDRDTAAGTGQPPVASDSSETPREP